MTHFLGCGIDIDLKGSAIVICDGIKPIKQVWFDNIDDQDMVRVKYIVDKTVDYIKRSPYIPDFVGVETEARAFRGKYSTIKPRLIGHLLVELYDAGFTVCEYSPLSIKAFAGNGKFDKAGMKKAVKDNWNLEFNRTGKSGKLLYSDDLTDAYVVCQLLNAHVKYEVLREDIKKQYSKKQFDSVLKVSQESQFYGKQDIYSLIGKFGSEPNNQYPL